MGSIGSLYNQPAFKDINFLSGKSLKYFLSNYQPKQHEHGFTCSDYLDEDIDFIGKLEEREEAIKSIFKRKKIELSKQLKAVIIPENQPINLDLGILILLSKIFLM